MLKALPDDALEEMLKDTTVLQRGIKPEEVMYAVREPCTLGKVARCATAKYLHMSNPMACHALSSCKCVGGCRCVPCRQLALVYFRVADFRY